MKQSAGHVYNLATVLGRTLVCLALQFACTLPVQAFILVGWREDL